MPRTFLICSTITSCIFRRRHALQGHMDAALMVSRREHCIADGCVRKRLQLNGDKTELLWFGSTTNFRRLPTDTSIRPIQPATVVRDRGVWIDSELYMREHVSRVAQARFPPAPTIRSVRRQLGHDVSARLVSALVLSRLDYCNAVLVDLPAATLAPLQRVARFVLDLKPHDHVTHALRELHWFPVVQRIEYKLSPCAHGPDWSGAGLHHQPAHAGHQHSITLFTRASSNGDLFQPRIGDRAFSVAAPRAWNRLSTELKLMRSSTATFRRHLKCFLCRTAH